MNSVLSGKQSNSSGGGIGGLASSFLGGSSSSHGGSPGHGSSSGLGVMAQSLLGGSSSFHSGSSGQHGSSSGGLGGMAQSFLGGSSSHGGSSGQAARLRFPSRRENRTCVSFIAQTVSRRCGRIEMKRETLFERARVYINVSCWWRRWCSLSGLVLVYLVDENTKSSKPKKKEYDK